MPDTPKQQKNQHETPFVPARTHPHPPHTQGREWDAALLAAAGCSAAQLPECGGLTRERQGQVGEMYIILWRAFGYGEIILPFIRMRNIRNLISLLPRSLNNTLAVLHA